MKIEGRLKELGIALPKVGSAMGTYVHAKRVGDLLYLSGKGPLYPDGKMPKGKLGAGMSVDEGYRHARPGRPRPHRGDERGARRRARSGDGRDQGARHGQCGTRTSRTTPK